MIEQITFRELRSNLSKYLDRMEQGEVFEVRGKMLGFVEDKYMGVDEKDYWHEVKTPTPIEKLREEIKDIEERDPAPHVINSIKTEYYEFDSPCDLCGGLVQLYSFYDESERKVCESCLKSKLGKGAKKYLAKTNMIVKL